MGHIGQNEDWMIGMAAKGWSERWRWRDFERERVRVGEGGMHCSFPGDCALPALHGRRHDNHHGCRCHSFITPLSSPSPPIPRSLSLFPPLSFAPSRFPLSPLVACFIHVSSRPPLPPPLPPPSPVQAQRVGEKNIQMKRWQLSFTFTVAVCECVRVCYYRTQN